MVRPQELEKFREIYRKRHCIFEANFQKFDEIFLVLIKNRRPLKSLKRNDKAKKQYNSSGVARENAGKVPPKWK